jgi:Tfp pilus assembly protein PilP
LKLVAIITIPEGNIALVEDSLGKGYFLKKGTVVGKNDGKVKQILTDMVTVEEVYGDFSGQKKFHEVSLFLYRSEKEGGAS